MQVATLVSRAERHEPVLTNIGSALLGARGFEREGEAAMVQEWRCEMLTHTPLLEGSCLGLLTGTPCMSMA